jgi:hypothetical protein
MPGKAKQIKILNMAFYEGMYVWFSPCKWTHY